MDATEVVTHIVNKSLPFNATDVKRILAQEGIQEPLHYIRDLVSRLYSRSEALKGYHREIGRAAHGMEWHYLPKGQTIADYQTIQFTDLFPPQLPSVVRKIDVEGRLSIPATFLKQIALLPQATVKVTVRPRHIQIGLFGEEVLTTLGKRGELRLNPPLYLRAGFTKKDQFEICCREDHIALLPVVNVQNIQAAQTAQATAQPDLDQAA